MFVFYTTAVVCTLIPIVACVILGLTHPIKSRYGRSPYGQKNSAFNPAFIISIIVCLGLSGGLTAINHQVGTSGLKYKEVWGYRNSHLQYWEKWTEKVSYTVQVPDGYRTETYTSNGKTRTRQVQKYRTETRYRTDTHGPYWYVFDQYGDRTNTNSGEYNSWKGRWKNEKHVRTNIGTSAGMDRSISGKVFETRWDNTFENMYPVAKIKTYKNIIRATTNTFSQREPTEEELKAYPRPADVGDTCPIQCFGKVGVKGSDTDTINKINAIIGPTKQCRLIFMLFDAEKYSRGEVDSVLAAWNGTNKNELVIFAGLDRATREVKWISVQSWMDDTTIHSLIEGDFQGNTLEIAEKKDYWIDTVNENWKRKEFTDETKGFGYIKFSMPWHIVLLNALGILLIGGITVVVSKVIYHKSN